MENQSDLLDLKIQKRLRDFLERSGPRSSGMTLKEIVLNERKEAFSQLMQWDKLLDSTLAQSAEAPSQQFSEDGGFSLDLSSFSRLNKESRRFLLQAIMYEKRNWSVWKDAFLALESNKKQLACFESEHLKELVFLCAAEDNIDRAVYYNELIKNKIKKSITQSNVKQSTLGEIGFYSESSAFFTFLKSQGVMTSDEYLANIVSMLRFSKKKNASMDFNELIFSFNYKKLYLGVLDDKLRGGDTALIQHRQLKNAIALAQLLFAHNDIEQMQCVLDALEHDIAIIERQEDLSLKHAKTLNDLSILKLQGRQESPQAAALLQARVQANC